MDPLRRTIAAQELVALLDRESARVVERWSKRVATAMPQLFEAMEAEIWASRLTDTFLVFRAELETAGSLDLPVFSRKSGSMRLLELGARAVRAHLIAESLDPHEFQSAYFLLQQAMLEIIETHPPIEDQLEAFQLVDHFIKQLSIAMSMAASACLTGRVGGASTP